MLCDRVQIINQGKLIHSNTIEGLTSHMQSSSLLVKLLSPPSLARLNTINGINRVEQISKQQFRLHFTPENNPCDELIQFAAAERWQLRQLNPEQHSLEDVFMKIIQDEQVA